MMANDFGFYGTKTIELPRRYLSPGVPSSPLESSPVAGKALQLHQLGMSCSAIARKLDVTDKTVAKAIAWLRRVAPRHDGKDTIKRQNGYWDE
jgi:hypothetical protein